jgi:hypothetical protein
MLLLLLTVPTLRLHPEADVGAEAAPAGTEAAPGAIMQKVNLDTGAPGRGPPHLSELMRAPAWAEAAVGVVSHGFLLCCVFVIQVSTLVVQTCWWSRRAHQWS